MRGQSGTTSLRALLYMDEIFGFFPPHPANPPTKRPLLTLLKQARAQGIAQPSVNILVAAPDDAAPDGYVMPDLTGIPIITAQAMLTRIGLKVDTPSYADVFVPSVSAGPEPPVPPIAPGTVISEQPMAGARVDQTTMIKLTAAK